MSVYQTTRNVLVLLSCAAVVLLPFGAATSSPPLSDIIKRVEPPKEYEVEIDCKLTAYQHDIDAEEQFNFNLKDAPIVFPVIPDGGFHQVDVDKIKHRLRLDDVDVNAQFELLPATSLEVSFARFVIREARGKQVDMHLVVRAKAFKAKVNEKQALKLTWPEVWPPYVHSALQPQWYVQSTNEKTVALAKKWNRDKPQSVPPYVLAKEMARQVVRNFQISGRSYVNDRHLALSGLEVRGSDFAAERLKGSSHDAVCLFVGVCRASGLPARPVIGIDFDEGKTQKDLISWAEVFLPNAGWVSFDFRELYRSPGSMRDIMRPWPGVGTNPDMDEMVPIAHHFHPPYNVRAEGRQGRPLLWGWIPYPEPVPVDQRLYIKVRKAPKRAGG